MPNLPHVPRCQRLGSCLGGGPMSCRIVVAIGRQRHKKSLNFSPKSWTKKYPKNKSPPRIKSNKPVHLHVLPPKNKTHHSNPPNPFNPQSTQAAEDDGPGRPVASGFAEGQRLAVLEQLGELSLKPLWRCRDIMEDCVFDVFTVDVLYKWFFLFIKDNEAACLTLFSLELI